MNAGKFIDRNPDLRAAGLPPKFIDHASDSFKMYSPDEMASFMLREKCLKALTDSRKHAESVMPHVPSNEVSALLAPELQKSRFVVFRERFSENMFFQKPSLGKSSPALTKPDDVTNESRTFGAKTISDGDLYEIVFPKKTPDEVSREYFAFHDRKIISHHRYLPSERINRSYKSPPFDANYPYGKLVNANKDGLKVKRCLQECESTVVISKVQKEFLERTQGALGEKIKGLPFNIDENIPMGRPPRQDPCDVKSLLENIDSCFRNTTLLDAIIHINKLRRIIFTRHNLHINDLVLALKEQDILNIGYLPLESILKVTGQLYLHLDAAKIHTACTHFQLLRDLGKPTECIDYNAFCKLLQIQFPIPAMETFTEVPSNLYNKDTCYRDLCKDIHKAVPADISIDSPRTNRLKLIEERIKAGDKTTAKILTSPDIPMIYGLEPGDFEKPRNKSTLYRIFQRLLCEEKFNEVWQRATELFKTSDNLFTVNEIRLAMDVVLGRTKPENLQSNEQSAKRKDLLPSSKSSGAAPLQKRKEDEITSPVPEQQPTYEQSAEPVDKLAGGDDITVNTEKNDKPIDGKI